MVLKALKRITSGPKPVILVFLLLLASLYLMSAATQNSAVFGELYSLLLAVNILALVLLVTLILRSCSDSPSNTANGPPARASPPAWS